MSFPESPASFPEGYQPSRIDCSDLLSYENYAQCQIRSDITHKLRMAFMFIFFMNLCLLFKNIWNLISIRNKKRNRKVTDMITFNILLLPLIIIQLALYSNGFLIEMGMPGTSLFVYGLLEITQALVLNNLFALGAFLWVRMVFKLSFNNGKTGKVKAIFILCLILNSATLFLSIVFLFSQRIEDNIAWSKVEGVTRLLYIMVTISTTVSGFFFVFGVLYVNRVLKEYKQNLSSSKKMVSNLAVVGAFVSLLRVAQDIIQCFGTVFSNFKLNSILNDDWNYAIYLVLFFTVANVLPELIFLIRYSPKKPEPKPDKYLNSSTASPVDDPMYSSNNKNNNILDLLVQE